MVSSFATKFTQCRLAKLKEEAKSKRETVEEAEKRKEEEAKERARLLTVCDSVVFLCIFC